jgi:PST family polysaccharide transporter
MSTTQPAKISVQAAEAVRWTAVGQLYQIVLQLVVIAFLARLVGPHAYGLVGTTALLTGVAGVFRDLGVSPTLIQRPELTDRHIATARIMTLGMSLASGIAIAAGGAILASFVQQPELGPLCIGLGGVSLVGGLGVVSSALLQRQLRFRLIVWVQSAAATLSFAAAVAAAALGMGAWALVIQGFATALLFAGGMIYFGPSLPAPRFYRDAARDLFGMSAGLTGVGVMNLAAERVSQLFVARAFGTEAVGLFERAYALSRMPVTQIAQVVTRVMVPALSAMQFDAVEFPRFYRSSLRLTCFLGFPATIGLASISDGVVRIVMGPGWERAIPMLQAFALLGAAHTFCHTMGWVFTARGRSRALLLWTTCTLLTRFAAGWLGSRYSVETVAWLWVATDFVALVLPGIVIIARMTGVPVSDLLRDMLPSLGAALLAGACAYGLQMRLTLPPHLQVTLLGTFMLSLYLIIHLVARTSVGLEARTLIHDWFRRRRGQQSLALSDDVAATKAP